MILRSLLFVPGHNKKLIESASKTNADAIILDVEDSVLPIKNKDLARSTIVETLKSGKLSKFKVFIRIDDRESGQFLKDMQSLAIPEVTGFIYPKALGGKDIYFFDKFLKVMEIENNISKQFYIIPLIETTSSIVNLDAICKASDRVVGLAFGCEDYVADLQGLHTTHGSSLYTARSLIAITARANNIVPIDTVHIDVHDLDDFEKNIKFVRELGFEGCLLLHPKEISIAHKYFTPSKEEIDKAKEMIRLSKQAESMDKGVAVIDGKFIGPPMLEAAKKLLDRSEKIGLENA